MYILYSWINLWDRANPSSRNNLYMINKKKLSQNQGGSTPPSLRFINLKSRGGGCDPPPMETYHNFMTHPVTNFVCTLTTFCYVCRLGNFAHNY